MRRDLEVRWLGRVAYGPTFELQQRTHAEVADARASDTLYLLEHERVVTLGKNTGDGHVLATREDLALRGFELHATDRGGDVTYHGPGQLVGYPIVALQPGEQDIKGFVWKLEELLIRTCADFGVTAERVLGLRGVWVGRDKIGAIGVRIARWTTMHGFALNVAPKLEDFQVIVPCGIADRGVTSLERLLGEAPSMLEVRRRVATHAGDVLGRALREPAMETT